MPHGLGVGVGVGLHYFVCLFALLRACISTLWLVALVSVVCATKRACGFLADNVGHC